MDQLSVLKQYFGHDRFRPGQEALIDAALAGRDVLGVMPTGGGKSLCYQVPALLSPGLTLVISPLISLMKDQVAALRQAGAEAAFLNSSLTLEQMRLVYRRVRAGAYKLLYVAPERLLVPEFLSLARETPVSLLAVDEAHCISQWGQDFRPSYLKIADFLSALPSRPPVAAFTATATAEVRRDIARALGLRDPLCVVTGFDRPNLFFDVRRPKKKLPVLLSLVREREGKSGIVYCNTRAAVERVYEALRREGIAAARYHAGLEDGERRQNQDDFQYDRISVMVATNAFGMGIDKSNVGYVIHYNMPKSLEAYYQEAGRAGRDGERAECILLWSPGDVRTAKILLESGGNGELDEQTQAQVRARDGERLEAMLDYCKTTHCLRGAILDYFGQPHGETCANCGNCLGRFENRDVTVPAQMALSCVVRVREKLGYYVGKSLILQTLRGGGSQRVRELGLDQLTTYGLMRNIPPAQAREYLDFLEQAGYLRTNPLYNTLEPTAAAGAVLFRGETVAMPVRTDRPESAVEKTSQKAERGARPMPEGPGELFDALRALRRRIAQEEDVPAYIVFSNAALADMAARAPRTMEEFLKVNGVGRVKAERYGERFLAAVAEFSSR